jgi:hypothetical protein
MALTDQVTANANDTIGLWCLSGYANANSSVFNATLTAVQVDNLDVKSP